MKRRTGTTDGYSGPCFLGTDEGGVDAIVAIHRWSSDVYDIAEKHTRRQFPLILAWAITVHKSQGLTLSRATFNPGDDEVHCGGTFTALTRVRHPMHFAFSVTPSFQRLIDLIACKDALYERKMEEWRMRSGEGTPSRSMRQTADRHMNLHPPASAFSLPPAMPRKVKKVVQAPKRGEGSGVSGSVSSNSGQPATGRTPSTAPKPAAPKAAISTQHQDADRMTEAEAEAAKRQMQLNVRWFTECGLPSVYNILGREMLMQCPHPPWLQRANQRWRMEARIIDFWSGGAERDAQMRRYLEFLGF